MPRAKAGKRSKRTAAQVPTTELPAAMTGRASAAKAEVGDEPVFAYIRSLPQPQRAIAERVDALAARTLPALQRSIKVGDGVLWRRRRLVLLVWRLRRPCEAHLPARHRARARTTGGADRDGQGFARRGPAIRERPRRRPGGVVDAASRGPAWLRGQEVTGSVVDATPCQLQRSLAGGGTNRYAR